MNWIYRIFCWAGGGESSVLEEMPTERNRFLGYGSMIYMTAIFATLSAAYAFSLLLKGSIGYFFLLPAIVWGIFIFFLDRFFIVTISNRGRFWKRLALACPRLILAVFIGMIISKPLEFRIFEREINDELENMKTIQAQHIGSTFQLRKQKLNNDEQAEINKLPGGQEIATLNQRISDWQQQLAAKDTQVTAQAAKVNCECNGACGTGIIGKGPACDFEAKVYKQLQEEKMQLETNIKNAYDNINIIRDRLQQDIGPTILKTYKALSDTLAMEQKDRLAKLGENYQASILNQQLALVSIGSKPGNATAVLTGLFITILFIIIEMAPMLLKLMTSAGAYESRVAQIEAAYSNTDRLNRSLNMAEYKSNRSLVQRLARSQRNIINNAMDQWHRDQLRQMKDDPELFNSFFTEERDNDHHQQ